MSAKKLTRGIYLRGDIYWLAFQKDKKRHFVSLDTGDLSEAIRKAAKERQNPELKSGHVMEHTVDRYCKYAVKHGLWTRATDDSKGYVLEAFAKWCGAILPSQVTPDKVLAWHQARKKKVAASTAFGNLMTVRGFFNWCRDVEKCVKTNPCIELKVKAPETVGRRDFCTAELRDTLIEKCTREDLKFVLYCGFHAGLRIQEIVEARPFWFDLNAGLLHLRKTPTMRFKDREERTIPLTAGFKKFLEGYGLREPFMLRPERTHRKNRYRFDPKRPFNEFMAACECPWVTFHTMRHTFASLLASAGVSIYKISVWLGDDVRVTQRHYAKLVPGDADIEKAFHSSNPSQASSAASNSTRS